MLYREVDQNDGMSAILGFINTTRIQFEDGWVHYLVHRGFHKKRGGRRIHFQDNVTMWNADMVRNIDLMNVPNECALLIQKRDAQGSPGDWICVRRGFVFDPRLEYTRRVRAEGGEEPYRLPDEGISNVYEFRQVQNL